MIRSSARTMAAAAVWILAAALMAQQAPRPQPYIVGNRLGLPINPAADGTFNPIVLERQGLRRDLLGRELLLRPRARLIVVPNRGVRQNVQTNNAWVSFINHDGSVHTARWIGMQNPGDQRDNMTPPLVLNEPLRQRHRQRRALPGRSRRRHHSERPSDLGHPPVQHADRRARPARSASRNRPGSTTSRSPTTAPSTRRRPVQAARIPTATTWQVWKITRDGAASIFVSGRAAAPAQRHRLRSRRATSSSSTSAPTTC